MFIYLYISKQIKYKVEIQYETSSVLKSERIRCFSEQI